ncbi:MAG: MotA/TolQ/ExbB proton channel family protein [Cystobacterineae bacterium]|nr:MotA/TolQ/ExbB proton channel family protein [Cystobacterineae bacterium]
MFASINYWDVIRHASFIELFVLALLAIVSVISWALVLQKGVQLSGAKRRSAEFLEVFWRAKQMDSIYESISTHKASPLAKVFKAGYEEMLKLAQLKTSPSPIGPTSISSTPNRLEGIENIERALQRSSMVEIVKLESALSFLGTVGATSPFVGLFGTVMGILSAFNEIAQQGNASIATVAAPIGNALLATAAGLFAAIPAVVAYNAFLNRIRVFDTELSNFSSDFLNIIKRNFFS